MRSLAWLRAAAARFFRRRQVELDMEEELRSHIQHRADDLARSGLDRAEAERRARIEFGGRERFREECYESLGANFLDILLQDLRFSIRVLAKSPGFTIVAVLTLALGIGANAVVFGVLNALVIRPLNVPRAESLYTIQLAKRDNLTWQSYPDYIDLRDRNRSFDDLATFNISQAAVEAGDNPSTAWGYVASGNYFDALGIQPSLGRFFHASDEHGPNSAPYVVLTWNYWQRHFQGDRGVVGRVVRLNKHPFTVIGVTPSDFHGTVLFFSPDFFMPLVNQEQVDGDNYLNLRGRRWIFMTVGHLKHGVTPAQAVADLNSIGSWLEKTYPAEDGQMVFSLGRPSLVGDFLGGPVRAFVTALMLLAGMILLAACANLGSLFAARSADRSREVALRLALGSGRSRILRTMFTEAVLLSIAGGALGLMASVALLQALSAWQPFARFPIAVPVNPDANVYAVALILAVVSGILFGIVPVRQVLRADPYQIIKAGKGGGPGRRVTVRDLLLVAQIAICAVLVTSSMVAVRGLTRSLHSNFGFEPRNAMLVNVDLKMAGYSADTGALMQRRMIDAVGSIRGVESVGMIEQPPLDMGGSTSTVFTDKTTDLRPANAAAHPYMYAISPEYFHAAGTALLAGRTVSWHDDKASRPVAVVNLEFARKVFGSTASALGGYYKRRDGTRVQVVGIVDDGKYLNLAEAPKPAMFLPTLQFPSRDTWLAVRSHRDPQQLAAELRSRLWALDAGLPLYIQTWNKELDGALFPSRVATIALGVLGVMGAMLSITGVFGMAAYSVSKRLRELGIRIALGAQRKQVLQAAVGRAFRLLAFGSAAGLFLGILASRVLAVIVYHATPRDPLVLAGVVFAMLLLGLLATWIPAHRAMSVDPVALLREE